MAEKQIRVGDEGTRLIITVKDSGVAVNLISATILSLKFSKPSGGALITKTAQLYSGGADGRIYYDTEAGLITEYGIWKFQVEITFPSGKWTSDIGTFRVYPNLD